MFLILALTVKSRGLGVWVVLAELFWRQAFEHEVISWNCVRILGH